MLQICSKPIIKWTSNQIRVCQTKKYICFCLMHLGLLFYWLLNLPIFNPLQTSEVSCFQWTFHGFGACIQQWSYTKMLVMLGNAFYPTIFIKTNILRNQKQLNLKFNQGCLMQKKKFTLIKITFCGYIKHDLLVCSDWMFVGVAKLWYHYLRRISPESIL